MMPCGKNEAKKGEGKFSVESQGKKKKDPFEDEHFLLSFSC